MWYHHKLQKQAAAVVQRKPTTYPIEMVMSREESDTPPRSGVLFACSEDALDCCAPPPELMTLETPQQPLPVGADRSAEKRKEDGLEYESAYAEKRVREDPHGPTSPAPAKPTSRLASLFAMFTPPFLGAQQPPPTPPTQPPPWNNCLFGGAGGLGFF
ncbi:hypothetical protein PAPYR_4417 [Paratrimastix pyriformis]|uniref:Uncharacterized protein n=1 Tax=Paratrimastix pyriformis TaxID=342808 RepID=A0ABQ8UMH9_9EUKA|nr:hypothetical protein PAPYR_4417 [Paratrimastix pyriformis]